MVAPIVMGIAAVVGGFILLRILTGSSLQSEQSKRKAEKSSLQSMAKIRNYEQNVEALNKRIKSAPDRQREMMAKRMELLLKQKERLKHKTERLVRKS